MHTATEKKHPANPTNKQHQSASGLSGNTRPFPGSGSEPRPIQMEKSPFFRPAFRTAPRTEEQEREEQARKKARLRELLRRGVERRVTRNETAHRAFFAGRFQRRPKAEKEGKLDKNLDYTKLGGDIGYGVASGTSGLLGKIPPVKESSSGTSAIEGLKIAGGAASILSSGATAAQEIHHIVSGDEDTEGKALAGVQVGREAVNTTYQGLSIAADAAKHAGGALAHVAAPIGLAKYAIDAGKGTYEAVSAQKKKDDLKGIYKGKQQVFNIFGTKIKRERELTGTEKIARVAKGTQKTKRNLSIGKVAGGVLGVAGAAVLLGAGLSNPIGLGLLAGAAGIGLGMKAYEINRKRKLGLKMDANPGKYGLTREEMDEVNCKTDDKNKTKWGWFKNRFKNKNARRYEMAKEKLAEKLYNADGPQHRELKKRIIKNLGLKETAKLKNIKRKL